MASEGSDSEGQAGTAHEPRECMACRGTGRVISNLGGTPGELTCPWCAGAGMRVADIDAQAVWAQRRDADADAAGDPAT
jgi:DnaJ-class molecular chaperone